MKAWPEPEYVWLQPSAAVYHVHRSDHSHDARAFNPHKRDADSWRFSPFPGTDGKAVPSWYGALRAEGALYETVFRDVVASGRSVIDRRNALEGRALSRLVVLQPLRLVQLMGNGLMRLLLPTSFTTGGPETYRESRKVANELHDQFAEAHGFMWRSRINNDELTFVLYGDRVSEGFASIDESHPLDGGRGLSLVMRAANRINCTVT